MPLAIAIIGLIAAAGAATAEIVVSANNVKAAKDAAAAQAAAQAAQVQAQQQATLAAIGKGPGAAASASGPSWLLPAAAVVGGLYLWRRA